MKRLLTLIVFTVMLSGLLLAAVPPMINYQGRLTDAGGSPVSDGNYSVVFTIYDAASGGASKWTETQNVTTTGGLFALLLGSVNPILDTVFNGTTRYMGVQVGADPELTPRTAMVSVPYAQRVSTVDGTSGGTISGNVGIGESSPINSLHIKTKTGVNSSVTFPLRLENDDFGDPTTGMLFSVEGLALRYAKAGIAFQRTDSWAKGNLLFLNSNSDNTNDATLADARMAILPNGRVGIGTTAPEAQLEVAAGGTGVTSIFGRGSDPSFQICAAQDKTSNSVGALVGEFGVRYLTNPIIAGMRLRRNSSSTDAYLSFSTSSLDRMTIEPDGDVGIGTSTPSQKLHVAGNICATGSIGACSDMRYKTDVVTLTGTLDKVSQLRGVAYRWKVGEYPEREFEDGVQLGFIAQEIETMFPEVVQTDKEGFKSVDYGRLTPVLVEAIKEQQKRIDEQQKQIDELRKSMQELAQLKQVESSTLGMK